MDEATGTTALEALSTQYKKAAELAKKSSKVALSLLVVLVAFLGFNSVTGKDNITSIVSSQSQIQSAPATTNSSSTPNSSSSTSSATPAAAATAAATKKSAPTATTVDIKSTGPAFAGVDANGVPTGFTVTDSQGHTGALNVSKAVPVATNEGLVLHATAMTIDNNGVNVLLDQNITIGGSGTSYVSAAQVSINRFWNLISISSTSVNFERQSDGNYLLTATMSADPTQATGTLIPVSRGVDVTSSPTQITTKILLNPGKSQILAQAIYVATKGAK
jgi:hypothetical protein